jgi:hypothetical protein
MPCSFKGLLTPTSFYSQFGIADIDWSNAKQLWVVPPMDCDGLLVKQVNQLLALNPDMKVFVYRNLVKALPWYTSVRKLLDDPQYEGFFLKFDQTKAPFHVPACDNNYAPPKCSVFYHDQDQTPGYPGGDGNCPAPACDCGVNPCGEYLWNHANGTQLRSWFIREFVFGANGLGNSNISGFYFDDGWTNTSAAIQPWQPKEGFCDHSALGGATEEDFYCSEDMGLTQADTTAITDNWRQTMSDIQQAIVSAGAFSWQSFYSLRAPNKNECASTLRSSCSAGTNSQWFKSAVQQDLTTNTTNYKVSLLSLNEDLATFLLQRGDYAWLGYGWLGCDLEYVYPPEFNVDYGVPVSTCSETTPNSGVFTRDWTKATVQMDCNTYTGTITMK